MPEENGNSENPSPEENSSPLGDFVGPCPNDPDHRLYARGEMPNLEYTCDHGCAVGGGHADPEAEVAAQAILAGVTDPHYILNFLRENSDSIPLSQRHPYYEQWKALVALKTPAERDALVHLGHQIFHYRTETARREIEELARTSGGGGTIKWVPCVIHSDFMAELIHVPNETPSIRYLKYYWSDGRTETVDEIQVGPHIYKPPDVEELVEKQALILPTGVAEYESTGALMQELQDFLNRFVALDQNFSKLTALYALYTWIFDKVPIAPYFNAVGDFSTGKSTWLQVTGQIVFRARMAAGILTPAGVYRALTECASTLLIDESDFDPRSQMWQAMRTVMNVGNSKRSPITVNESSDKTGKWAPKAFTSFGPKVLAMRHPLPDSALGSRTIQETFRARQDLRRDGGDITRRSENIPLILNEELDEAAVPIRNKLLLWRFRNHRHIVLDTREHLDDIEPRVNQIALVLLATCGNENSSGHRELVLEVARQHSKALQNARAQSLEGFVAAALLKSWKDKFRQDRGLTVPPSVVLLDNVVEKVKRDNGDYKDISNKKVSDIIHGPLGLFTVRRSGYSNIETIRVQTMKDLADKYKFDDPSIPWEELLHPRSRRTPVPKKNPVPVEVGHATVTFQSPPLSSPNGDGDHE